ncbi:MAG: T9SS type A sorting domain-containing protein, partial [Flavobacterium sp.]
TFNGTGTLTNTKILDDYYWFPAVTVFPDNAAPVVNATLPSQVSATGTTVIDLKNVVSDTDNLSVAIVKSVKSNSNTGVVSAIINTNDELVLTPQALGNATVVLSFNSNGKVTEKSIEVNTSTTLGTGDFHKLELAIYPNPVSDVLNIRTQDEVLSVNVYDVSGKTINARVENNQINVSNFIKGMYIINVVTDKANYVQKFIKQ